MIKDLVALQDFLESHKIFYEQNIQLRDRTWIHRGGKVQFFISPSNVQELRSVCHFVFENNLEYEIVGNTSNVYFLNEYNPRIVISTRKCNKVEYKENYIECECGVNVMRLAKECISKGICGFEYLSDLPGTVGAAIYNNSSCKENSVSKLLLEAELLTEDGSVKILRYEDFQYSFRSSILKEKRLKGVILNIKLNRKNGSKFLLEKIAKENHEERLKILEGPANNLGCTFNSLFINGAMPIFYKLPLMLFKLILSLFRVKEQKQKEWSIKFILIISGNKKLIPYVSKKLVMTYVWRDNDADKYFPQYVQFMRNVYKTDKLEIEIFDGNGKN